MTAGRRRGDTRVLACCGGMVVAGGAERMVFEVLAAARAQGAVVHCILNGWAYEQIARLADGIGAKWTRSAYEVRFDRRSKDPRVYAAQARDVWRTSRDLWHAARAFRPTHILVPDHETVLRNYPTLLLLRATGVRTIMKLCNAPAEGSFYRRLWRWVVNPAIGQFVCNSDFTRAALAAHGLPPAKMSRVYETLPRREAAPAGARDPRKVVFVGQVIPPKGLHVLLDAVASLAAEGRDVTLDVVGDVDGWISPVYGDYRDRIKARAAAPDLAGRVRFLGWREDVPAIIGQAAVLCCPSLPEIRESFGLVVLEAKSVGVPAVVFRCGALPEQIRHGVDGYICERVSATDLAAGLAVFLGEADRCREAGEAARTSAITFSQERFRKAWVEILRTDRARLGAAARRLPPQPVAQPLDRR
jgi:glycosyltransferase involved in cell wall biosynthesis